ncbi:MAG: VWA domain-containing protein [Candidatus Obscuribacterales bacterium]|nr:VWA domain-containing protein [Candidatus Obscuribacterales bacterium]
MTALTRNKQSGQAMLVLAAIITLLIIFAVGLFSYEINRLEICRSQLRSACEAAALAAAATLASQDNLDPTQGHTEAIQTALDSFQRNSVAGVPLASAIIAGNDQDSPGAENSSLFIEFLDPNNNNQPVSLGDPSGKLVRVTGAFGLKPSFGNFLGLPLVPLRTDSIGGVPDLDVVLCFDVSGSIDDQTPVTLIRRQWNGDAATGTIQYIVPPTSAGCPAGPRAQGRLYDIFGPAPTGTALQALAPQNLGEVSRSEHRWKLNFSEDASASRGLRGATNAGSPPGNYPGGRSTTGNSQTITDIVVNIDGRNVFGGISTADGYNFPDVATLIEAARGNLENQNVFTNSRANRGVPTTVLPRPGYQAKYIELAMKNCHPIYDAQIAASEFFTIMNTNTVGHFGIVCFSDNGGTGPGTTISNYNVDSNYSQAGQGRFPNPAIILNPSVGATNYDTIEATLPTLVATGGTNIGDVLSKAVDQLRNNSRNGSKKAIVLFTDGMPTVGNPLSSDPWTNARKAAQKAKQYGIPIYAIGLAQNPEIVPLETSILNDTNSNPANGGVCAIAGNGGKFFLVTDTRDLRKTFENIARQLVQLVHS